MNGRSSMAKLSVLILAAGAASLATPALAQTAGGMENDPHANLPATLELTGVVRDFKWANDSNGGHPDFQRQPTSGFGHYVRQAKDQLGADGKPVFRSTGYKVSTQWRDAQNRNIMEPRSYIAARVGDQAGARSSSTGGSLSGASSISGAVMPQGMNVFDLWFRDVPGVNLSKPVTITLRRNPNSNVYTFDDKTDPYYMSRGGFFPIDNELYGNPSGQTKNFGFSYELETQFVYTRGAGHVFTFTGDDDVFVYIDGKLVVDLGGVHAAISQSIDLDRLEWLESGRMYTLKVFHAERHTTQSNFRIDTTLQLRTIDPPTTSGLYD